MKYNPFRPGSIVTPGMFAGRGQELRTLEQILFQTKHGNPQHFLVTGERGIGKSSLLYYFQLISTGKITTPSNATFKFLTLNLALEPTDDFKTVVRKVGTELVSTVSKHETFKKAAKATWDFLKRWEIAGIKFNSESQRVEDHQLLDDLCQTIINTLDKLNDQVDGCLLLIDESDKPPVTANLGAFCKLFTEQLTKHGTHNVTLGLAGVTGIVSKLRDSHESSPRVFHTITLDPLTHDDRLVVINRGLDEANGKSSVKVTISTDAAISISTLSEGYPNFIQQFAFCAFNADSDNLIDIDDVTNGAFNKDGAFHQLGQKYFSELYFDRIGSDEYRDILRSMAEHGDEWVTKAQLKKSAGLKPATLNNGINALKKKGIILPQPGKQGVYKLPNRSFSVWIKAFTQDEASIKTQPESYEVEEKGFRGKAVSSKAVPMPIDDNRKPKGVSQ
jgi:hypothetical protein